MYVSGLGWRRPRPDYSAFWNLHRQTSVLQPRGDASVAWTPQLRQMLVISSPLQKQKGKLCRGWQQSAGAFLLTHSIVSFELRFVHSSQAPLAVEIW